MLGTNKTKGGSLALSLGCLLAVAAHAQDLSKATTAGAKAGSWAQGTVTTLNVPNDKACQKRDQDASEGDSFVRVCPALKGYRLQLRGDDLRRPNYGIVSQDGEFATWLHVDGEGEAARYARADRFREVLDRSIEWQLDAKGRPYAVIALARLYPTNAKAAASAKPAAEVFLVRGLRQYAELVIDIDAAQSGAFVPVERARRAAAQYAAQHPAPSR